MVLERFRLDGKLAVVTGASSGIGRASALALAESGARVVLAARGQERLEAVAREVRALGAEAHAVPTDVTDGAALDALARGALELGGVDVLVNVAGGTPPTIALATSDADLAAAFQFNVTSAFHLCRALAPSLAERSGAIVNISSAMSHRVDSGFVAYGAAKAALDHVTRLLAHEWAPKIRVNAVAAGATRTEALAFVTAIPELEGGMIARTPLARLGEAEDIAAAVLYLASPASAYVTGQVLAVDGGAPTSVWPMPIPSGL
ncbi:MAG: SDR family oxidoreductase [Deltaproteobacteria bacterium]|nr:SDR family oxidoreductase [Deltaproteobacteria bacterium]